MHPWQSRSERTSLDAATFRGLLGPVTAWAVGPVDVVEQIPGDGFVRRHLAYDFPSGRASVIVCIPNSLQEPAPLVYCHHQAAGQFDLGKSEVVGLRGDPNQAYAAELARRGYVTIAADSIGFEDRNWAEGQNISWFELASRLVVGRTLLADELQEIALAIDYGLSLPEVCDGGVGFIGHSFGGRIALWAPAWDHRITASVSNCGCISYRESAARDAGFQADTVVPGFACDFDIEDLLELAGGCEHLVIAGETDRWSRGVHDLATAVDQRRLTNVHVLQRPGGHTFRPHDRELAYAFLDERLHATDG